MKLKIEGTEYDLAAALERPTLFLVREMKIRTGYGIKSIMDAADSFEGKDAEEILDDPDLIGALIAMIWLARRQAGEQLTFEQAGSFDITQLVYEDDAPAPALEADTLPKAADPAPVPAPLTDSAPAAELPQPAPVELPADPAPVAAAPADAAAAAPVFLT
jgi:hypothetical protein